MIPMKRKVEYFFHKINGEVRNGGKLEVIVDGETLETPIIQRNIVTSENLPRVVRIIGSEIVERKLYETRRKDFSDVITHLEQEIKQRYGSKKFGITIKPKVEIRYYPSQTE